MEDFTSSTQISDVVDGGQSLALLLGMPSAKCNKIGTTVLIKEEIARGQEGTVYKIGSNERDLNDFVVKLVPNNIKTVYTKDFNTPFGLLDIEEEVKDVVFIKLITDENFRIDSVKDFLSLLWDVEINTTFEAVLTANNLDASRWSKEKFVKKISGIARTLLIPNLCTVTTDKHPYASFSGGPDGELQRGDYVCPATITETAISAFLSVDIATGECPHFTQIISFISCDKDNFTFMERIDTDAREIKGRFSISKVQYDGYLFQLLFAIGWMQKYKISHQDLHMANVFIKYISDSESYMWKDKNLGYADYLKYTVENETYYLPSPGFLVKVGDYGFTCKYKHPRIIRKQILEGMFIEWNVPNTYMPTYDVFFTLNEFYRTVPQKSPAAMIILSQLLNVNRNQRVVMRELDNIIANYSRPDLEKITKLPQIPAVELFKAAFSEYTKQPPDGSNIASMSEILVGMDIV